MSASVTREFADVVRRGLTAPRKSLPAVLLYDEQGSALFEAITELPEYYVTRTERAILERHADTIAAQILTAAVGPVAVLELGAGTATKTDLLLRALAQHRQDLHYYPADVSQAPLEHARQRLAATMPALSVTPLVGTHGGVLRHVSTWEGSVVVLFLGSSIGNYENTAAAALLTEVRVAAGPRGTLLLGVDREKPLDVLLPAYDDAAGVTAAFNRNVLTRINRELDGDFNVDTFRHVACWNDEAGAVEMHLESSVAQHVQLRALQLTVPFAQGERIHTESSHKYSDERVQTLFNHAALTSVVSFEDDQRWFSLQLARPATNEA